MNFFCKIEIIWKIKRHNLNIKIPLIFSTYDIYYKTGMNPNPSKTTFINYNIYSTIQIWPILPNIFQHPPLNTTQNTIFSIINYLNQDLKQLIKLYFNLKILQILQTLKSLKPILQLQSQKIPQKQSTNLQLIQSQPIFQTQSTTPKPSKQNLLPPLQTILQDSANQPAAPLPSPATILSLLNNSSTPFD